jgi:hypothetical protein
MAIKVDTKDFDQMMRQLKELPGSVMKKAEPRMKRSTPVDSGNARSKTRLKGDTKIVADYGYAGRLDDGWSKQSPKGFTEPTEDFIEDEVTRQIRRIN